MEGKVSVTENGVGARPKIKGEGGGGVGGWGGYFITYFLPDSGSP